MKDPWIPSFLPFEQENRNTEAAAIKAISDAKAQAIAVRSVRKAIEAKAKQSRQFSREFKAKEKLKGRDLAAQCGFNLYFGNSGWAKCLTCGLTLIYRKFDIATSNPQICIKKSQIS